MESSPIPAFSAADRLAWTGQRPGAPLHHILFVVVLWLILVPGFGAAAWLLADMAGSHVPRSASMAGVLLSKIHQLPLWAAVGGMNLAALHLRAGARHRVPLWLNAVPAFLLSAGALIFYAALWLTGTSGEQHLIELAATGLLLSATLLTAGQVLWLLWARPGGIALAHLFLAAGAEWLLVFGSADLMLRLHFAGQSGMHQAAVHILSGPSLLAMLQLPPAARFRLMELAQLGVLVNLVYGWAAGTWPGLFALRRCRPRAWLLTLVLHNLGLALLATGIQMLDLIGCMLMLTAAVFFLVGLNFVRAVGGVDGVSGRAAARGSLLWLLAGVALLGVQVATQSPGMGYDALGQAVEHALMAGFFGTLVLALALALAAAGLPEPRVPRKLLATIAWTYGIATALYEVAALCAIPAVPANVGSAGGAFLSAGGVFTCMAICAATQCGAMLALGLVVLRTALAKRSMRTSPG